MYQGPVTAGGGLRTWLRTSKLLRPKTTGGLCARGQRISSWAAPPGLTNYFSLHILVFAEPFDGLLRRLDADFVAFVCFFLSTVRANRDAWRGGAEVWDTVAY
jgi:hypothetical protein